MILQFLNNVEEYQQVFRKWIDKPKSSIYLFKNYMQHKEFDHFKLSAFLEDITRYRKWRDDSDSAVTKRFGVFEVKEDLKDRKIDKRIMTKIYRERQVERPVVGYKQLKDLRINAVTSKFRKIRYGEESEPIKVVDKQRKEDDAGEFEDEAAPAPSKIVSKQAPVMRMDIQQPKVKRTQIAFKEIKELQGEPFFIANYFKTNHGKEFIRENPQKPPNEEVLMRMSQRMSRSIGATEGLQGSSHDADHLSAYSQNKNADEKNKTGRMGSYHEDADAQAAIKDNPIVALEPEDDENRDQMRMSGMKPSQMKSKMKGTSEEPNYIPSMYLQEKDYFKRKDEETLLKAEEYHDSKTKEFSVYGKLRPLKFKVKSLAKSTVKSEMNERFITTESITDKRIKISSMAGRAYINAPSVNQVRKQGQHQMILQAIAKKQTFNELISQANAMITSVLNDPLKRSVNILPSQANFGSLKEGSKYEVVITCK